MARTVEQIKAELDKVSEDTRKAYDAFKSRTAGSKIKTGVTGGTLEQKYKVAVREKNEKDIAALRPLYEDALAKYRELQDKKNALTKEFKAAQKTAETEKVSKAKSKAATNVYEKAIADLKEAELDIKGFPQKYQEAYRKAEAAYNEAVKSGINPTPPGMPKIEVPAVEDKTKTTDQTGDGQQPVAENISDLFNALATDTEATKIYQKLLQPFGWSGNLTGQYDIALQSALNNIAAKRASLPKVLQGNSLRSFLENPTNAQTIGAVSAGAAGGAGGAPQAYKTISPATTAAAYIQDAFKTLLNRDATEKEVSALTKILNDAEEKNPSRTVNGKTTGGIDRSQFLADLIKSGTYAANKKAYPGILSNLAQEASARKLGAEEGVALDNRTKLMETAKANGVNLSEDQINGYLKQIKTGKDIEVLKQTIRSMAGLGMPDSVKKQLAEGTDLDTIYSPYRNRMASVLEIPSAQIDINDPALRSAIGMDKEMPLYEFEKALRKDSRWQYTNNARETVSDAAMRVLQDFGFQG